MALRPNMPDPELARVNWFVFREGNYRHCSVAQFVCNAHWTEPSPRFVHRARPSLLSSKIEYTVLAPRKETAVQAVVGSIVWFQAVISSIVWTFCRLKKPRSREMSACSYALYKAYAPKFTFFLVVGGNTDVNMRIKVWTPSV